MRKISVLFIILSVCLTVLLHRSDAGAFGGCEEDCSKCHSLDKTEAQQILAKLRYPDAKILEVKMSPIRGLWEVAFESKIGKGIVYVGFSKNFAVKGSVFEVDTASNKTQETLKEINKPVEKYVDISKISAADSLLLGDVNAANKVYVFTDPDCPFCSRLHNELKKVVAERNDIAFYLKLMPLKMHPDAYWKARSIMCGKSLKLLEDNFDKKPVPKPDCESKVIDENIKLGAELGITGTPTLVMPDGFVAAGAKDAKSIIDLVQKHKVKDILK